MLSLRKAVIQSSPSTSRRSSSMRLLVIMPRSPISTTRVMPNRLRILLTWAVNVGGSAVLPEKTSMATGQPSGAQSKP